MAMFYRRLPRFGYLSPKTMGEAITSLNNHKGSAILLAGGTDLIPQLKRREIAAPQYVIDLKGIPALARITYDEHSGLTIGSLATISAVAQSVAVRDHFPALSQAASVIGSPQVRNRGTLAGNICSAVPSADSAPSLLIFSATLRVTGPDGERTVPLDEFFTGPRQTTLQSGEIVTEIHVPSPAAAARGVYLKLSPRHSMDLAIVGVAATAVAEEDMCKDVRIALGAVAPTPIRVPVAETLLRGQRITSGLIDEAARNAAMQCSPIDDHRASAEYRRDMVYVMTRRALNQVLSN